MSRKFDHGKNNYAREHRNDDAEEKQHTKHYIANSTMEHYGAKPENYKQFSSTTEWDLPLPMAEIRGSTMP